MKKNVKPNKLALFFEKAAAKATRWTGSPYAFLIAFAVILVWLITGPVFGFSDTWQLVINTGTTIITFLMVFLIQQSQNKDVIALHLKLNELIASNERTSNRLISSEDLSDKELRTLKEFYIKLSALAKKEKDIFTTHSLDEAQRKHDTKHMAVIKSNHK
ncbi:MAG: low affinity iron permease family protein [Saprospiraceae bacterium]